MTRRLCTCTVRRRRRWHPAVEDPGAASISCASYYNLGLCYLTSNKSKKAIETFKEALRLNNRDAESSFYLAIAYIDLKDDQQAITALHETLAIDLEHEKSHYLLGRLYFLRGDNERGERELLFLEQLHSPLADSLKKVSIKP